MLPFVVPLLNDEDDPSRDGLIVSSIWFGLVSSGTGTFLAYALIRAFVKEFLIGIHLVVDFLSISAVTIIVSILVRRQVTSIVPFEAVCCSVPALIIQIILFKGLSFIPGEDVLDSLFLFPSHIEFQHRWYRRSITHGQKLFEWPLRDEIAFVVNNWESDAFVFVDDFKVPHDLSFGFDVVRSSPICK